MRSCVIATLICCCSWAYCTERMPWFGNDKEFGFRALYASQAYNKLREGGEVTEYSSDDSIISLSLALSPSPELGWEIECSFADTGQRSKGVGSLRATGRYLWLNDVVGDPISLSSGVSLSIPTRSSLRDLSTPYHGDVELEVHVAIGKEYSSGRYWVYRYWGDIGYGFANEGLPWVDGQIVLERNFRDVHQWSIFGKALYGLGSDVLNHLDHGNGYSTIGHQSIDIGAKYAYTFDSRSKLAIEYSRGIHAHSFPMDVDRAVVSYFLPFSMF